MVSFAFSSYDIFSLLLFEFCQALLGAVIVCMMAMYRGCVCLQCDSVMHTGHQSFVISVFTCLPLSDIEFYWVDELLTSALCLTLSRCKLSLPDSFLKFPDSSFVILPTGFFLAQPGFLTSEPSLPLLIFSLLPYNTILCKFAVFTS